MEEVVETLDSTNEEITPEAPEPKKEYTELEKKLYARAKKAEEELKKLKEPETPKSPLQETVPKLSIDDKVDLRLQGYTKTDIEMIERNMANRSLDETLADPYVKAALETVRATAKAQDSTTPPSDSIPTFTAEKKTWAQMTEDERRANYQQAISRLGSNAKRVE